MDLSIIILSYNTRDITDEALRGLPEDAEVIVLDNASIDGSVEMIRKKYPRVKLIVSKVNTGFSKGNNIAMKQSNNPIILFLNSDCFVEEEALKKAYEYFKSHDCDVLGVKLVYENGRLQPSAGYLPTPLNAVFWILGLSFFQPIHPQSKSFFERARKVGWTSGAFLMIRKEVFNQVGGFDENIFMYMDEVDLCKRVQMAGFSVCFTPSVQTVHLQRASQDSPEKVFTLELKGMKYYFQKYFSNYYPLVKFFLILGLILRIIAFSLLGKTKRARAYVESLGVI